ncbi:unnamed protein product [Oppiella nova]|uniref:Activator of basal transcription 1 n=1 Tax=Oppiella nova TaxID=334625 RepID=A0A7R9M8Q8_9ACAR|nr:unnamed protein product [Oppiella nova]CAG2172907.1 unnamed protein product [Oppiella nova]
MSSCPTMDQMSDNNANDSCGDPIAEHEVTADQSDDQSVAEEEIRETNSSKKPKSGKKVVKIGDNTKNKRGIVYLSYVPMGLNATRLRQLMAEYGEVNRIFLQKERSGNESAAKRPRRASLKKSYNCRYVEGWVEFRKKSVAKLAAGVLNGQQIGGKRRTKFYDQIWSLKYLHKFKWSHLAEQLSYEKAFTQQKLRFEISRAKKENSFYEQMTHKFKYQSKHKTPDEGSDRRHYKQRVTDELIRQNKPTNSGVDFELLSKIFK